MTVQTIEDAVKARARGLGFDLVGITTADPFPEANDAYQRWIEAGMHAGMGYMAAHRERVGDPRRGRAEARSIVAVAMNYYAGEPGDSRDAGVGAKSDAGPGVSAGPGVGAKPGIGAKPRVLPGPRGRIARYAWGDDYHLVMEPRLRDLATFLAAHGARMARWYVDTGPLLDRAIAQRAGLGWCGRHTCLITREFGTWVVLGEILTDLDLRPDPPARGDCGLCDACTHGTEACPTGAIVAPGVADARDVTGAPGVVDARRCIAYWTIEHRGWIPRDVRPTLADWIFGCDLCQEACPFNRLAQPTVHREFHPRPETGTRPLLLPLLNITEEDYRRRFRRSAVKRATRSGLRRNAAVALGNLGVLADPGGPGVQQTVAALAAALRDPGDPVVRGHAAWALGRIGGADAAGALEAARLTEVDPQVQDEIRAALAEVVSVR